MNTTKNKFNYIILSFIIFSLALLTVEARASGDVVFRDDFMGKSLRPEWEITVKDPRRMSLIDNEFLLLVTYGPSAKNNMVYKGVLFPSCSSISAVTNRKLGQEF